MNRGRRYLEHRTLRRELAIALGTFETMFGLVVLEERQGVAAKHRAEHEPRKTLPRYLIGSGTQGIHKWDVLLCSAEGPREDKDKIRNHWVESDLVHISLCWELAATFWALDPV